MSLFVYFLELGDYFPYMGPLPGTLATSPGAARAGAVLQVHRERRDPGLLQHRDLRGPHLGALLRFYLFTEQKIRHDKFRFLYFAGNLELEARTGHKGNPQPQNKILGTLRGGQEVNTAIDNSFPRPTLVRD